MIIKASSYNFLTAYENSIPHSFLSSNSRTRFSSKAITCTRVFIFLVCFEQIEVIDSKIIITNPNNKENTALETTSKPNTFLKGVNILGKILTISIIKAENSQRRVYFNESAFFLKNDTIIPRKQSTPVINRYCSKVLPIIQPFLMQ